MKNLLKAKTKEEIIKRIDKLSVQSKPLWGKMNVNQNMRHLALSLEIPLGTLNPTPVKPIPLPKWLLKFLLLNMKPPKEKAETFKELDMVTNSVDPIDFEMEKNKLKNMIGKFTTATSFIPENKFGGKFSKDDWGKLNYNHIDHHLRQFGV